MMNDVDTWRTITLGVAAVGQTSFALLYLTFPWWRTFLGRALFAKAFFLTLIIDFAFASRIFHFGRNDVIFLCLYSFIAIGIWAEFLAFLRTKFQDVDQP